MLAKAMIATVRPVGPGWYLAVEGLVDAISMMTVQSVGQREVLHKWGPAVMSGYCGSKTPQMPRPPGKMSS